MHVPQTEVTLRHEGVELARVTLPLGEYVIGRSAEADVRADTPLISRKHALRRSTSTSDISTPEEKSRPRWQ